MSWLMLPVLAVLTAFGSPNYKRTGIGTEFYPVEKYNNGIFACSLERWHPWQRDAPVCAHRTLPCGSWVFIKNLKTKKTAWCKIMDRGPYGKRDKNGIRFNSAIDRKQAKRQRRPPKKGRYIALIDKSSGVTKELGATGFTRVRVYWWKNNPKAAKLDKDLCNRWEICKDYR